MNKRAHKRLQEQTTTGGAVIQAGAHIDGAQGIYDRPATSEKPVVPSEMVANQLTAEKPPVEDEDYVPISNDELCRAVAEISKSITNDNIEKFYLRVKECAEEFSNNEEDPVQGQDKMQLTNETTKRKVKKMINEILDELEDGEGAVPLSDIAKQFGFRGPSGARQYIGGLTSILKKFIQNVQPEDLERLKNFAVGEYADLLEHEGYIEAEEADELRTNGTIVEELDSFRYFFSAAFVIPVMRRQNKIKEKQIYKELAAMGAGLISQALMNQLMGYSKKNPAYIKEKLAEVVKSGKMSRSHADLVYSEVMANYARLENYAKTDAGDIVEMSLNNYQSVSAAARAKLLKQALAYTNEDAEGLTKYE